MSGDWFPLRCWWNHPSRPPCECEHCLANDEITRLRAAGDALADAANDDLPSLWTIATIAAWEEARRDR